MHFPDFKVIKCEESLVDFTGDYFRFAEIEFEKCIDDQFIQDVVSNMKNKYTKWHKSSDNRYICDLKKVDFDTSDHTYWSISIKEGDSKGYISYGRV